MYIGKQCLAGVETIIKSPACRMDTWETPATKATDTALPPRVPGEVCIFTTPKTFLTKEEIVLAHTGMCCLLFFENKSTHEIHPTSS